MPSKPSLAELFATEPLPLKGPRCTVGIFLTTLSADDLASVLIAMTGPLSHATIARVITKYGTKMSGVTVARHRKHLCSCE